MRSARPRCKAVLMPRPFITQDGCLGGREAMTTCLARAGPFLAGVRSPPLHGAKPGTDGLAGKTRRQRERWFSRRDALCASAWQGPTNAEAFHFHPTMSQQAGWPTGHMPQSTASPLAGVRSPPLHGDKPGTDGLAEEGPEMTRETVFSEGRTLCVRLAGPYARRGIT